MADEQQTTTESQKPKRERRTTRYVVLRDTGDGLTFHRVGDADQVFEGNRTDALNEALDLLEDEQKTDWLVPVPESSFKAMRQRPRKPQRASFTSEDE